MRRRTFLFSSMIVPLAFSLNACGQSGFTLEGYFFNPHRFRLTVEIETPNGLRRGSSIIEVRRSSSGGKVKGEAVAVELPNGQTVFALLRSSSQETVDWAVDAFGWIPENVRQGWVLRPSPNGPDSIERDNYFWDRVAEYRGTVDVPRARKLPWAEMDTYPILVRFQNIDDPESMELVDPDDFAAAFGPGYRLKSITATFTADPVTQQIEDRLKWLKPSGRQRPTLLPWPQNDPKSGKAHEVTIIHRVAAGDFSTELHN